jgi:hypothetical protein
MVSSGSLERLVFGLLAAAQTAQPVLERLDPQRRTAVIMAIIWMVVTCVLLVVCTMLGARWVRRIARQRPRPPRLDDAALSSTENRNLRAALDGLLPNVDPNDTIHTDRKTGDTRIDR